MSRGPYPILLMLAMSLPGAARALGLGDIRVDSALNEPLSAQIDITGATRDDLIALTAKIPNREIFQRYGAERPSFLSSATFKIGLDAHGRPVLNVRSAEAFTDPVINFLVELRWANGELVRDYSLLLDPAGFSPSARATAAANVATATKLSDRGSLPAVAQSADATGTPTSPVGQLPNVAPSSIAAPVLASPPGATAAAAPQTAATETSAHKAQDTAPSLRAASHHRVATRDTLRAIARRAGVRSEAPAQRLMIAIFRANPHAFDGNINRLHDGALLNIPSAAEAETLDAADARREYRTHMTAWRLDGRQAAPRRAAATPVTTPALALSVAPAPGAALARSTTLAPITARAPVTAAEPSTALARNTASVPVTAAESIAAPTPQANKDHDAAAATAALTGRVHSLEDALDGMHQQLEQLTSRGASGPAAASGPAEPAPVPSASSSRVEIMRASAQPVPIVAAPAQPASNRWILAPMAAALALLLAGFAYVRRQLLRSRSRPQEAQELEDHADTLVVALDKSKAAAPQTPMLVDAVAVSRPVSVETPKQVAPITAAPAVREILDPAVSDQTTQSLAIDAEALERSYLDMGVDSLGIDSVTDDTATHDMTTVDTAAHDMETVDTATHDMTTVDTAAHDMATFDDTAQDTTTLDKSMLETVVLDRAEFDDAGTRAAPTVSLVETRKLESVAVNSTVLDYNLLDLDATVHHVQMPSQLHDHVVVTERRTNIIDVLKAAIDRDPNRRDLRMKLLETYYSSAATNQRAFMEVVRNAASERDFLSADDWQKVVMMGREIASGDALFADQAKDGELANCA